MALGIGEGAELRAPRAITVVGGLLVAKLLTGKDPVPAVQAAPEAAHDGEALA